MPPKDVRASANMVAVAPPLSPSRRLSSRRAGKPAAACGLADLARQEIAYRCRRNIARGERLADTARQDERELAGADLLVLGHERQQGLGRRPFVAGNILDVRRQPGTRQVV